MGAHLFVCINKGARACVLYLSNICTHVRQLSVIVVEIDSVLGMCLSIFSLIIHEHLSNLIHKASFYYSSMPIWMIHNLLFVVTPSINSRQLVPICYASPFYIGSAFLIPVPYYFLSIPLQDAATVCKTSQMITFLLLHSMAVFNQISQVYDITNSHNTRNFVGVCAFNGI